MSPRTARLPTLLLICMVVIGIANLTIDIVSANESSDYSYILINGESEAEIVGYTGPGGDVVIPDALGGVPVTRISEYAFYTCNSLTSVVIPDTITYVGEGAFGFCYSLTSASIGDGVTELYHTFVCCPKLASISLGNNVTEIGELAFGYCFSLSNITIPASVNNVGSKAFSHCAGLANMTFEGNAPSMSEDWDYMLYSFPQSANLVIYHYYGSSGFSVPTWNGLPCVRLPVTPAAPTGLYATPADGHVELRWRAPSNGGAAIDYYTIYENNTAIATTTNTSVNITDLKNGQEYSFTVTAHNVAGSGPNSTPATATPSRLLTVTPPLLPIPSVPNDAVAGTGLMAGVAISVVFITTLGTAALVCWHDRMW